MFKSNIFPIKKNNRKNIDQYPFDRLFGCKSIPDDLFTSNL